MWTTSRTLTIAFAILTLIAGTLPAAVAYVGSLIVDAVVAAIQADAIDRAALTRHALLMVAWEGLLVAAIAGAQRGISLCQSLLRAQLGQRVNVMILEKALTLELEHFENSEFYDKLTRARREASSRPLSLVMRTFGLVQNAVSLISFGTLLINFSPWAVAVLVLAGLPAFLAEAKFSGDKFRLFLWRSPETRMQLYLETVLAREDHAKEVKLFGLGPLFLERYRNIFRKLYARGSRPDDSARHVGLLPRPDRDCDAVRRLRVDRALRDRLTHYARPDDDVPDAVPPGTVGGLGDPLGDRRHVRGQPVPVDALRVSRNAGRRTRRAPSCAARSRTTACASSK